jgi:hypothetical protein
MKENGTTPERGCPSELSILTDSYADERDKDAVRHAFYDAATGDPKTAPVQFSVLIAANAQALKAYPDRLKKVLETETRKLTEAIIAQQEPITTAAEAFEKNCFLSAQLVQKIQAALEANTRHVFGERQLSEREWAKRVGDLNKTSDELRRETSKLLDYKKDLIATWICLASGVALVLGIFGTLAFQRLFLHWPTL